MSYFEQVSKKLPIVKNAKMLWRILINTARESMSDDKYSFKIIEEIDECFYVEMMEGTEGFLLKDLLKQVPSEAKMYVDTSKCNNILDPAWRSCLNNMVLFRLGKVVLCTTQKEFKQTMGIDVFLTHPN